MGGQDGAVGQGAHVHDGSQVGQGSQVRGLVLTAVEVSGGGHSPIASQPVADREGNCKIMHAGRARRRAK